MTDTQLKQALAKMLPETIQMMKTPKDWQNYFATTESTYRQKGELFHDWEARRIQQIQLDSAKSALELAAVNKPADIAQAILTLANDPNLLERLNK